MITNHWGKYVNSEEPITGVVGINDINIQVLNDEMFYGEGINISEEERLEEFKLNFIDYINLDDYSEEVVNELKIMMSVKEDTNCTIEFNDLTECAKNEIMVTYFEYDESYPDDTWLIGDWLKDENNQYMPDESGDYAAIVRESTIQVVYSKYVIRVTSLCSPCYPGQADIQVDDEGDYLTSDSGYLTYNLPDYFYDHDY